MRNFLGLPISTDENLGVLPRRSLYTSLGEDLGLGVTVVVF